VGDAVDRDVLKAHAGNVARTLLLASRTDNCASSSSAEPVDAAIREVPAVLGASERGRDPIS